MKTLLLNLLIFSTLIVNAQDETVFSSVKRVGAFGGPIFEFEEKNDEINSVVGGGGGLILNDFFVGGYGIGDLNFDEFNLDITNSNFEDVRVAHGGLWFGVTPLQNKAFHPYVSARLGWGKARFDEIDIITGDKDKVSDNIFVVTPELGFEINIFQFFRISVAANYRLVEGLEPGGPITDDDLQKFGGVLTLRFGAFGDNLWWD